MHWATRRQGTALAIALFASGTFLGSCRQISKPAQSTADERLQPAAATTESATGGTIYVPVYSTLALGIAHRASTVDLAATTSVRNVSTLYPITLEWVRYYDAGGRQVRDYLDTPSTLPPMASVQFVVQRSDTTGGSGATFLIRWHAAAVVDEPLVEAIMLGQSGNVGVSFSSRGRPLTAADGR